MSTEQEASDYQNIISLEASGDQIERLPNTGDERGRMLVMGKPFRIPHVHYGLTNFPG